MSINSRFLQMAAGCVVGLALLAGCFAVLWWVANPERFPLRSTEIRGELKRTSKAEIEAALPRTSGNFFVADLAQLRAAVEKQPWVRRVAVRRLWPDRLEITVEEHVALARWGDDALVNTFGERFMAKTKDPLPAFVGPAGTQGEVTRRYRRFSEIVAPLGAAVERLVLTPRHAWQLRLDNGQQLMLGRDADAAEARLRRFVELHAQNKSYEYVDLRYPNGFAVRMPEPKSGS